MKAALIQTYRQEKIDLKEVNTPTFKDNDVLVKIVAASINPVDFKIKNGKMKMLLKYSMPLILGSDFAGIVVETCKDVTKFKKGDKVYGRVRKSRIGTFAEYISADQEDISNKPENLTFEEAAAIPLVGLTSYQALHDFMHIKEGEKILIQAGSGGIGTIAIQLTKLAGAYVSTTTSERNTDLVKHLGADKVINYREENFEDVLEEYDYVLDTLGGDQLKKPSSSTFSLKG